MIIEEKEGRFSITLSKPELWLLASQCGQGIIYGLEDASEDTMSEASLDLALQSLKDAGVYWTGTDGQDYLDELILGMVYSCLHSRDMLRIHDGDASKDVYLHFLPDWNLSFTKTSDGYLLTYYQNRDVLHKHIKTAYLSGLRGGDLNLNFTCTRTALEAAMFLHETDKVEDGTELLAEFMGEDEDKSLTFLDDIAGGRTYEIDAYYNRHRNHNAVGYQARVMVGEQSNYLLRRIFSVEEGREVFSIQGLSSESVRHAIYQLLPKE